MTMIDKKYTPTTFSLNRKQIEKLCDIARHFQETEWFTLEESRSNGIGPSIMVKFSMFKDNETDLDTIVDITDVSTW